MIRRLQFNDLSLISDAPETVAKWMIDRARNPLPLPTIIAHVNVHNYYHFARSPELLRGLDRHAELVFDGIGMKVGSWLLGQGWPVDLNGTDLFPLVLKRAVRDQVPLFLLGSTEPVVRSAARQLQIAHPNVQLAGARSGYFVKSSEADVVREINRSRPGIVLIGRGCPLQEEFVLRNRTSFEIPVLWMVGGLFDFVSERRPRAPRLMRELRLEWLFRWALEPRGKAHRNLLAASWFFGKVLNERRRGHRRRCSTSEQSVDERDAQAAQ